MGKTTDYSLRRQFYADLIEAYKKVAPFCWSQQEAYERMVKEPAPRYYITPKQAYQVISPMMKGDFERVNLLYPRKRRLYYALFKEVSSLIEKPAFYKKSLWQVVQFAVARPAPEFFISAERAKHIRIWLKSGTIRPDGSVDESRLPSYVRTREFHREQKRRREQWIAEKMLGAEAAEPKQ